MKQEEKLKALDAALVKIEKDYGKGSVMKLGEYQADRTIEVTPTGSISLDIALGVGGVPKGRIIEIYGPESSGKMNPLSRNAFILLLVHLLETKGMVQWNRADPVCVKYFFL